MGMFQSGRLSGSSRCSIGLTSSFNSGITPLSPRVPSLQCGRGGTGRHTGLKILRGRPRAGSTPAVRTIKRAAKRKLKSDAEANAGPAPSDPAYTAARFLVIYRDPNSP